MNILHREVFLHILSWMNVKDICKNIYNTCRTFRIYFRYYSDLKITYSERIAILMKKFKCYGKNKKCNLCKKMICIDHQGKCINYKYIDWVGRCRLKLCYYYSKVICKSCLRVCKYCKQSHCINCYEKCSKHECYICFHKGLSYSKKKCLLCRKLICVKCYNEYINESKVVIICKKCIK